MSTISTKNELEQALMRVVFCGLIFIYLWVNEQLASYRADAFISIYFALSVGFFFYLKHHRTSSINRQWGLMLMDVGAVSFGLYLTNEVGGLFIGVYLG